MLVSVNPKSSEPIYIQIYDAIVKAIALGEVKAGENLPSSRRLAKDLRVNYITVNKAYNLLESEGFVSVEDKRVKVIQSTKENQLEFLEKWRIAERSLIMEARAKKISDKDLKRMFTDFVDSL